MQYKNENRYQLYAHINDCTSAGDERWVYCQNSVVNIQNLKEPENPKGEQNQLSESMANLFTPLQLTFSLEDSFMDGYYCNLFAFN